MGKSSTSQTFALIIPICQFLYHYSFVIFSNFCTSLSVLKNPSSSNSFNRISTDIIFYSFSELNHFELLNLFLILQGLLLLHNFIILHISLVVSFFKLRSELLLFVRTVMVNVSFFSITGVSAYFSLPELFANSNQIGLCSV